MYAEVAVNAPVRSTFHYEIPPELEGQIAVGHLVQVAFGTASQHGIVVALDEHSSVKHAKPIAALMDTRPVVTPEQIDLARWISASYLVAIGPCLWLWLPPGLANQRDVLVSLCEDRPAHLLLDELSEKIIDLLQRRGALRGWQMSSALPAKEWRPAVEALAKMGIVRQQNILAPPRVRQKMVRTAALAIHPNQITNVARHLGRDSKRADLLEVIAARPDGDLEVKDAQRIAGVTRSTLEQLVNQGLIELSEKVSRDDPQFVSLAIPRESVDENLITFRKGEKLHHILRVLARENQPMNVSWLYAQTDAKLADLKRLEEEGLIVLGESELMRDSLANRDFVPSVAPALTHEQQAVWEQVEAEIKKWQWVDDAVESRESAIFLVHGVTGSGKTEIYLRSIELAIAQGRQAIYLVPEIALTAQTIRRVAARFPGQVAIVHGQLSQGERYDTWRRARDGLVQVVVGARSALFTPLPDVGLVILDEEHDHSYKENPDFSQFTYHARRVAEEMMRRNHGVLILGDATPDIETNFRAKRGDIRLLRLPKRIMGHRTRILEQSEREGVIARYYPSNAEDAMTIDLPPVEIVDMRNELKSGNRSIFSRLLQDKLHETLERHEQAMLFLNRRGKNTYVFCRDCGYVDACPRCDMPLTYHEYDEMMRCHMCGYQSSPRQQCPACHSQRIRYFGAGTQQVEAELIRAFPMARVVRWDADTARTPGSHEEILQRFIERKADVLVGTQMAS
jgi:primosomal protein N' (replication factor Y) (superfamily II helicase)